MKIVNTTATLIFACCSALAAMPTNMPPQFVIKEGKEQLLKHPLIGVAKATVQTGWFTTNQSPSEIKSKEHIRLDLVSVTKEPLSNSPSLMLAQSYRQTQAGWDVMNVHYYREKLPTDSEIKACKTSAQTMTLLGFPQWADAAPYNAQWHFFTLGPSNTVETLSIFCIAQKFNRGSWLLDSLEVWRGAAHENQAQDSKRPTASLRSTPR